MLCVVFYIQELPTDFHMTRTCLLALPQALQEYYMATMDMVMNPDEGIEGTIHALQSVLLQSEFYIVARKPHRA